MLEWVLIYLVSSYVIFFLTNIPYIKSNISCLLLKWNYTRIYKNSTHKFILVTLHYTLHALFGNNVSVDKNVDVFNSYLHFCIETIAPRKIVNCVPYNKPWVRNELKELLGRKRYFHANNNRPTGMLKGIQQ